MAEEDPPQTPPIVPQDYIYGVKVVDIGDIRVARGMTRRPHSACQHKQLVYDTQERRIWCSDCKTDVEAFDAFVSLIEPLDRAWKDIVERRERIVEAEKFQVRSLAAKAVDEAWRKRHSVPTCPHCKRGLFPEHFAHGVHGTVGREYALALLEKEKDGK